MVETSKQVRVDNWGVFFLSRLQVFFNKTDYCDLTLQFEGNVQLKVHRLVMNACTEYFQILEETCGVVDDVLMMPPELQADVILPIVNFMYTGMLEFQMSIFERLYKTAEIMNITVLLQLLDAQRQPKYPNKQQSDVQKQPKLVNKMQHVQGQKRKIEQKSNLPATLPGRKLPVWKRKHAPHNISPTSNSTTFTPKPLHRKTLDPNFDNTPKPTRFEWPEDDLKNFSLLDSSFDNISYTSKPLLTQEEELRVRASTSFDSLRYLPTSNNGSKVKGGGDFGGSVDMDDLKSYVKEQKIRTDMVEFEDGDELMDDDTVDDPDYIDPSVKRMPRSTPNKKVRFNASEKENKEVKINLSPNVTTTSTSKADVDHTKIISEVLKKYPHLVKKNKNIRLKILAKKETKTEGAGRTSKIKYQVKNAVTGKAIKENTAKPNSPDDGPWTCQKCLAAGEEVEFVLYYLYRKHMTDVHNEKFDSRMCKYCGHKSTKHNMLMYHQYTKHGIKPPPAYNFPKCHLCPYVALTEALMIKHKLNHTKFHLQCPQCKIAFNSETALNYHTRITGHTFSSNTNRNQYDCQYCTKHYQSGANLFSHIRLVHRDEARRDGIVSLDEDEGEDMDELDEDPATKKIKILSDVSLHEEKEAEAETGPPQETQQIATNLNLVDIVVLDDNQQYIQQEFIPNLTFNTNSDITSTDELVMVLTDHDYNDGNNLTEDNSNIVVLYSHPVEGVEGVVQQQGQFIAASTAPGEGGLLLNSETGMLELKDGSESIELIQREIERHGNNNTGANVQECKAVVEIPQQETVLNIPDSTATFHHAEEEAMIHQHHEEEEHQAQPETQTAYIVQEVQQEGNIVQQENVNDGINEHEQEQMQVEQEPQQNESEIQQMEVAEEMSAEILPPVENAGDIQQAHEGESKGEEEEEEETGLESIEKNEQVVLEVGTENSVPQDAEMEPASEVKEQEKCEEELVKETSDTTEPESVVIHDETMQIVPSETTESETEKTNESVEVTETEQEVGEKLTEEIREEQEEIRQPAELVEEPEKSIENATAETEEPSNEKMGDPKVGDEEVSGLTMSSTTTETDTLEDEKKDGEVKSTTAKSLLDDWEDTDSQQSEHGEKSNSASANTVNKLINDWDDD